ncbi:hypothetical protein CQW39_30965 [Streptomyces griseofuscus]|uniref:hypothetical protein n=1 Tax=Streptomyces griseofuscus TaxID=146922 RepID=UPI000FBE4763|nr:hypothetical protein CQW39_30965 [Streptomyces griseofuscus]
MGGAFHGAQLSAPRAGPHPRATAPAIRCTRGACRLPSVGLYDLRAGQTPAQKAAKAACGQQPKKRPGKVQREATKRAQAAKKTGGGKGAKKTASPFRTEAQGELAPHSQTEDLLEHRAQDGPGRARVAGGLQYHQRPLVQVAAQGPAGRDHLVVQCVGTAITATSNPAASSGVAVGW